MIKVSSIIKKRSEGQAIDFPKRLITCDLIVEIPHSAANIEKISLTSKLSGRIMPCSLIF